MLHEKIFIRPVNFFYCCEVSVWYVFILFFCHLHLLIFLRGGGLWGEVGEDYTGFCAYRWLSSVNLYESKPFFFVDLWDC